MCSTCDCVSEKGSVGCTVVFQTFATIESPIYRMERFGSSKYRTSWYRLESFATSRCRTSQYRFESFSLHPRYRTARYRLQSFYTSKNWTSIQVRVCRIEGILPFNNDTRYIHCTFHADTERNLLTYLQKRNRVYFMSCLSMWYRTSTTKEKALRQRK